jgi:2,4-dienoyl-CoA reductase-like NADH-dependent reductase (Old Yellow Enzyme family)
MPALFEKTKIKEMELKNRLIRSATHEAMADENGSPTDSLFKLYERLAKGGVGMITTGLAFVSRDGKINTQLGMDNDELIPRYRDLTGLVHQYGTAIAMQIAHCGRQTIEEYTGSQPIAPSPIKEKTMSVKPREMTEYDIERIIEAFAEAARRVRESGFDAVQLHGAHGYLINEFLCPHTNRRKDKWGGSIENRMRFLKEIYQGCREMVGNDFPILIKMSAYDQMKKGLKQEEGVAMAEMMAETGFDGIEVSCGIAEDGGSTLRGKWPIDTVLELWPMYKNKSALFKWVMRNYAEKLIKPLPFTEAFNLETAKEIKRRVNIPIFLVGGLIDPQVMERIIEREDADYISLSRALIHDPNFPNKIAAGNKSPSKCLHCNICIMSLVAMPLRCHYGKWKSSNQVQ